MIEVVMPKLGESITEATIVDWKKKVGELIDKDEVLLEISTDKVDSEIPSPGKGTITEILYKKNDIVDVGTVIAIINGDNDLKIKESNNKPIKEKPLNSNDSESKAVKDVPQKTENSETVNQSDSDLKDKKELNKKKIFLSPIVKSIIKKENLNFEEVQKIKGSGANGRIRKSDLEEFIKNTPNNVVHTDHNNDSNDEMSHLRIKIAERMLESQKISAHVYTTSEADVTNIVNIVNNNSKDFERRFNAKLTYTPFVVHATIKALKEFPLMNASLNGKQILKHNNFNIGLAVALKDNNLIVPVIKKCEERNFVGITRKAEELAKKSRNNTLDISDVQDSTFTVTNPGVFGGLFGFGIINQPNVGILCIGNFHKRPVVKESIHGDSIVIRTMMYLTLGYDHRLIDGAYGTKFLTQLIKNLESINNEIIEL